MAENENQQAAADQPQFALQRIYIKDSSFESPNSPEIFQEQWQPEISLDLNTANKKLTDTQFEVVLSLTVTAKIGEKVAFIVELQQAGVFLIAGMDEAQTGQTIGAFCPNLLFPYARETIDSLVTKGSFPALMLSPINFDAIYAEAVRRQQEEAKTATH
jgi:preprotein translocase subunit SecB